MALLNPHDIQVVKIFRDGREKTIQVQARIAQTEVADEGRE